MGLAPYYLKNAISAGRALANFDPDGFNATLLKHRLCIAFGDNCLSTFEGLQCLDMTVRLFARLYPCVRLQYIGNDSSDFEVISSLEGLAKRINPNIDLSFEGEPTICLVLGEASVTWAAPTFYIGSGGWEMRYSKHTPVSFEDSNNPFGAGGAACVAAANVFKEIFRDQLPLSVVDESFNLSFVDYSPDANSLDPSIPKLDLGEVHLIGLGAIGNGALWAFSKLPQITGTLNVIDMDTLSLSNLQRYVMSEMGLVGELKTTLAAKILNSNPLNVNPHAMSWDMYSHSNPHVKVEMALVALDTKHDRVMIQATLPRKIINAGTGQNLDDFTLTRHMDFINTACLACSYYPRGKAKSKPERIAEDLGLRSINIVSEIGSLIALGKPVSPTILAAISASQGIELEKLMTEYKNTPIEEFHAEAVCGGAVIKIGADEQAKNVDAPFAFESVFAGLMLSAELILYQIGARTEDMPQRTRVNLIKESKAYSTPITKGRNGSCLCADDVFISEYQRMHP